MKNIHHLAAEVPLTLAETIFSIKTLFVIDNCSGTKAGRDGRMLTTNATQHLEYNYDIDNNRSSLVEIKAGYNAFFFSLFLFS